MTTATIYTFTNGFRPSDARKPMHELPYGFGRLLGETDFAKACATTIRALEEQQFTVVAQVDFQKTLEAKLELEFRRYVIFAVCDPASAERALEVDPHVGLLLLCNVVVQEGAGGGLYVAVETSQPLFQLTHHPRLKSIAVETERRLRLAVDAMG